MRGIVGERDIGNRLLKRGPDCDLMAKEWFGRTIVTVSIAHVTKG